MRIKNLGDIGYPNYEIDDQGNVYSLNYRGNTGERRKLRQALNSNGYLFVRLYNNSGKGKHLLVHRLVAIVFLGDWSMWGLDQVNHKNEVKTDNRVENIEWCDARYNMTYGTRIERAAKNRSRQINQYTKDGSFIKTFNSEKEASELTGVKISNISCCLTGVSKSAGNFVWRYKID